MRIFYHDDKPVSLDDLSLLLHTHTHLQGRLPPPSRLRRGAFISPSLYPWSALLQLPTFLTLISTPSRGPRQNSRLYQPRQHNRLAQRHGLRLRGQDQNVLR